MLSGVRCEEEVHHFVVGEENVVFSGLVFGQTSGAAAQRAAGERLGSKWRAAGVKGVAQSACGPRGERLAPRAKFYTPWLLFLFYCLVSVKCSINARQYSMCLLQVC